MLPFFRIYVKICIEWYIAKLCLKVWKKIQPTEPLKFKLSMKFQGVDFLISEKSSTANVLRYLISSVPTLYWHFTFLTMSRHLMMVYQRVIPRWNDFSYLSLIKSYTPPPKAGPKWPKMCKIDPPPRDYNFWSRKDTKNLNTYLEWAKFEFSLSICTQDFSITRTILYLVDLLLRS